MKRRVLYNKILVTVLIIILQLGNIPQVYAQSADTASSSSADVQQMPVIQQPIVSNSPYGSLMDFKDEGAVSPIPLPTTVSKLPKTNFSTNEDISLTVDNTQNHPITTTVTNGGAAVDTNIIQTTQDGSETITIMPPAQFKPGKYHVTVTDASGKTATQDFTWGVLAINTNKSIYAPGDKADLAMAVLDETGNMVCNATLTLTITDPKGTKTELSTTTTGDNGITINTDQCSSHKYTQTPDYEAHYTTADPGDYTMDLTAETKNGTHEITDTFQVKKDVPFDVERVTATRIYPPQNYPVVFNIKANQDFDGFVTETVPQSFQVSAYDGPPLANEPNMTVSDKQTPATQKTPSQTPDKTTVLGASTSAQTQASTVSLSANPQTPASSISAEQAPVASPSAQEVTASEALTQTLVDYPQLNSLTIPFIGNYPITEGFGATQTDPILKDFYGHYGLQGHDGIDFGVPVGTPIVAADDGKIITAGDWEYGKTVVIQHSWGRSYYGHLSQVMVSKDQQVIKGQQIALSGNTGESTGPHLHFGIRPNRAVGNNGYFGKIDPAPYLGLAEDTAKQNVLGSSTTPPTDFIHGSRTVTWHVSVKKGEKFNLAYDYLAPRISPQFYTLGPLKFTDQATNTNIFQEARVWQIAADVAKITRVQSGQDSTGNVGLTDCGDAASSTPITLTVTVGDVLISDLYATTPSGVTPKDSLGNTWHLAASTTKVFTAYAIVTIGGSDKIGFNFGGSPSEIDCDAIEYSGLDTTTSVLDQASSTTDGASGSHSTPTVTLAAPVELIHCWFGVGSTSVPSGQWSTSAPSGAALVETRTRFASTEAFTPQTAVGGTNYGTDQCTVSTGSVTTDISDNTITTFEIPTPTNAQAMRHGDWFENGVRRPMFW